MENNLIEKRKRTTHFLIIFFFQFALGLFCGLYIVETDAIFPKPDYEITETVISFEMPKDTTEQCLIRTGTNVTLTTGGGSLSIRDTDIDSLFWQYNKNKTEIDTSHSIPKRLFEALEKFYKSK